MRHGHTATAQRWTEQIPSGQILKIIPGATHLFEEPGTLEEVARLAAVWFQRKLRPDAETGWKHESS